MNKELTFLDLMNMTDKQLLIMQKACNLSKDEIEMIAYEIRIRSVELPEEWKLNNN